MAQTAAERKRRMRLTEFLKTARKDAGYKFAKQAAREFGMSYSGLRFWESGERVPNLELLNDYLDFLGVQLTIGRGGDMN